MTQHKLNKEWWINVFDTHNECGSLQSVGDNLIFEIEFFFCVVQQIYHNKEKKKKTTSEAHIQS